MEEEPENSKKYDLANIPLKTQAEVLEELTVFIEENIAPEFEEKGYSGMCIAKRPAMNKTQVTDSLPKKIFVFRRGIELGTSITLRNKRSFGINTMDVKVYRDSLVDQFIISLLGLYLTILIGIPFWFLTIFIFFYLITCCWAPDIFIPILLGLFFGSIFAYPLATYLINPASRSQNKEMTRMASGKLHEELGRILTRRGLKYEANQYLFSNMYVATGFSIKLHLTKKKVYFKERSSINDKMALVRNRAPHYTTLMVLKVFVLLMLTSLICTIPLVVVFTEDHTGLIIAGVVFLHFLFYLCIRILRDIAYYNCVPRELQNLNEEMSSRSFIFRYRKSDRLFKNLRAVESEIPDIIKTMARYLQKDGYEPKIYNVLDYHKSWKRRLTRGKDGRPMGIMYVELPHYNSFFLMKVYGKTDEKGFSNRIKFYWTLDKKNNSLAGTYKNLINRVMESVQQDWFKEYGEWVEE